MLKQFTIKELAEASGDEYLEIAALVKLLVKRGIAKEVGKRANPEGVRGKPSTIYEIPNEVELVLWETDAPAETAVETSSAVESQATENVPSATEPGVIVS